MDCRIEMINQLRTGSASFREKPMRYRLHVLKLRYEYWADVSLGLKKFEIRKDDRGYRVGDLIKFVYAGKPKRFMNGIFIITYKLDYADFPDGLQKGYCILSIRPFIVSEAGR